MSEYIEREAAKMALVDALGKGHSPFNAIVMLPPADVVPVRHGKWIWDDDGYHCSECFFITAMEKRLKCYQGIGITVLTAVRT